MGVSKISGIPFSEIMAHAGYDDVESPEWWKKRARKGDHHPLRQTLGKVSELASGFGGWIGAWKRFGADKFMDDDQIKDAILAWRAASPAIVEFWGGQERREGWNKTPELFGLEGMAIAAVLTPGKWFPVMRLNGAHSGISFLCHGDMLYCWLPSMRAITYHRPRLRANPRAFGGQYQLEYEGYNTNPQQGATGWVTMNIYGGKWAENVTQAVARDIQRHAIVNLEKAQYPVVLHVYDEDVVEVPHGFGSIEGVEQIMGTMPPWAVYEGKPWPIKAAGGWRGRRYRKE
jgi:DNA polymerase